MPRCGQRPRIKLTEEQRFEYENGRMNARSRDAPTCGSASAQASCAGHGVQLLRVTHSVAGKWVARATRPFRSATRRAEDRSGFLQRTRLYCLRARYPFRPASRRTVQASGLCHHKTNFRTRSQSILRLPQEAHVSFAKRTKTGMVSDGSIWDRLWLPAAKIKALARLFFGTAGRGGTGSQRFSPSSLPCGIIACDWEGNERSQA